MPCHPERTCHPERSEGSLAGQGLAKRFLVAALLGMTLALTACPESIHPLSDPAAAAHDPALFGVWR
jgi:hypothetical protein